MVQCFDIIHIIAGDHCRTKGLYSPALSLDAKEHRRIEVLVSLPTCQVEKILIRMPTSIARVLTSRPRPKYHKDEILNCNYLHIES